MKVENQTKLFIALLAVAVLLVLAIPEALATGDDDDVLAQADATATAGAEAVVNSTLTGGDLIGGDVIGGDTSISTGSNRAYAFSHGLGDVDINQCIVTKQTGTFIVSWQGYDYNLWCMGEVFDAKGLFKMGAEMRCDIPPIASKFEFREDCLAANTVDQEITESPQLTALYNQAARFEEHEEIEEQHDDELERVQMEQAILMERLDSYEQRLEERPAPVIVQQEPRISEEQIEQAWQLIKGAKGEPQNE
jgi:hypothetical protein